MSTEWDEASSAEESVRAPRRWDRSVIRLIVWTVTACFCCLVWYELARGVAALIP
jgi:hypothetical protein